MPNFLYVFELLRSWRLDADIELTRTSTPIITVLPVNLIETPAKESKSVLDNDKNVDSLKKKQDKVELENKKNIVPYDNDTKMESKKTEESRKKPFMGWMMNLFRSLVSAYGADSERQGMLPSDAEKGKDGGCSDTVCSIAASPYRILRAAESGNLDMFQKLYVQDPTRLSIRDPRGRTTAHQAAARNRINILHFITQQGGDLNAQDNAGNTPLHVAVESEALDAVDYLLALGVKSDILNEKKQAPVHLATELSKITVLGTMAKYRDKIDIQQGGEHGRTALHIAAIYDHDACARILQDMENYMEWKMMGVQKRMKKNVVPHIFSCQEDRKRTCPQPEQMTAVKRARHSIIQDNLCEASTSRSNLPKDLPTQQEIPPEVSHIEENLDMQRTVGVQVNLRKNFRSKYIQCNIHPITTCKGSSPIKNLTTNVALSPIKLPSVKRLSLSPLENSESTVSEFKTES
ncbi:unnamed protein product [Ceutorhynchus assimilis]|uniref:Uncharacterized protein n=1 Tax=Ceutorhynchus assimilis TaxID=467358 RepID=A0A9N9MEU3_9CUCU|nr:unnamed protein product [Ceutorhynchus assimilis]